MMREKTRRLLLNRKARYRRTKRTLNLHENAVAAQMEMSLKLLSSSPFAIRESFGAVSEMMTEFCAMARERDEWWRKRLRRERTRQAVGGESCDGS